MRYLFQPEITMTPRPAPSSKAIGFSLILLVSIVLVAMVVLPQLTWAQDAKAQPILQKTSATYKAMKALDVQFAYTLDNPQAKVKDMHTGSLLLQGNAFQLKIMGQNVTCDGQAVYTVMDEAKEVHIKSMADFKEETDLDPTTIFSAYEKGFKSKYVEETTVKGKKAHVIDLFPEDPAKRSFSRIRLVIESATNHILSSKSFSKDGSTFTLEVSKQKANPTVAANAFKVDVAALKAKGMEVVDLR